MVASSWRLGACRCGAGRFVPRDPAVAAGKGAGAVLASPRRSTWGRPYGPPSAAHPPLLQMVNPQLASERLPAVWLLRVPWGRLGQLIGAPPSPSACHQAGAGGAASTVPPSLVRRLARQSI